MQAVLEWIRRDPGRAFLLLALAAATALYAPTIDRGLVNYDDAWLVRDNFLLANPSLHTIFLDTSGATRFVLGAEYLPVRDLSIALDISVWGDLYPGFHLTNVLLYLVAIAVWFAALVELGVERTTAGFALLIWAVHPAHAESVAWISERKGLLALAFSGAAAVSYARFRVGRSVVWLAIASLSTVCAVWSKAPGAFAIASLAVLELFAPKARNSGRRSVVGLAVLAVSGVAAFVPVILTALHLKVVTSDATASSGSVVHALGLHGFYVQLAAMAKANAISYPIATEGPTLVDIVVGAVFLLVGIGSMMLRRVPRTLQIAAAIWLVGWFPASRLLLPLRDVLIADRYLLFPSLGFALAIAVAIRALTPGRARTALATVVVLAASMRTLDAQASWRDNVTLWRTAVRSNPQDGAAWSFLVEALEDAGQSHEAYEALASGLRRSRSPRLLLRKALLALARGQRPDGVRAMRAAAEAGEPRAMANVAILLQQDAMTDEALQWARRVTVVAPLYAKGFQARGRIALAQGKPEEAVAAYERAYALAPVDFENRFDLARALLVLGRMEDARRHLLASLQDPRVAPRAEALLARLPPEER